VLPNPRSRCSAYWDYTCPLARCSFSPPLIPGALFGQLIFLLLFRHFFSESPLDFFFLTPGCFLLPWILRFFRTFVFVFRDPLARGSRWFFLSGQGTPISHFPGPDSPSLPLTPRDFYQELSVGLTTRHEGRSPSAMATFSLVPGIFLLLTKPPSSILGGVAFPSKDFPPQKDMIRSLFRLLSSFPCFLLPIPFRKRSGVRGADVAFFFPQTSTRCAPYPFPLPTSPPPHSCLLVSLFLVIFSSFVQPFFLPR